jgi:tetratricopeptide (TPR) repeat protein
MKIWTAWTVVLTVAVAALPTSIQAETARQDFAQGEALLAKANFPAALQAFAKAARKDQDNQDYVQRYAVVRQVIALRQHLDGERDSARWEYFARGLHSFYVAEGLLDEALALDKKMHAKLKTASAAKTLAETQLALNLNEEAAKTLAGLAKAQQTPATQALHGLALARQGEMDQARQIAASVDLADDAGPGMTYSVARLNAAVGNHEQALALLTRCFESLAPSRLAGFKDHAKKTPEFTSLVSTAAFDKVMLTESKIHESKCSGGTSCANCPMRGQCSGSQGN